MRLSIIFCFILMSFARAQSPDRMALKYWYSFFRAVGLTVTQYQSVLQSYPREVRSMHCASLLDAFDIHLKNLQAVHEKGIDPEHCAAIMACMRKKFERDCNNA